MACGWQNSCRPWSCNYLQNAGATTYKNFLQFYAKKACKKQGATASSIVYTMVEMAKANDLNTYKYLAYLLSQRPNDKMSDEQLEQLAPWSETVKANCQN